MNEMTTMTVRIPDDKNERLKAFALHRKISIKKLMEDMSAQASAEFDTEVRFRTLAAVGNPKKGLDILEKFDDHFGSSRSCDS